MFVQAESEAANQRNIMRDAVLVHERLRRLLAKLVPLVDRRDAEVARVRTSKRRLDDDVRLIDERKDGTPGLAYILVVDDRGEVVAHTFVPRVPEAVPRMAGDPHKTVVKRALLAAIGDRYWEEG